jgi:hypothetical protein
MGLATAYMSISSIYDDNSRLLTTVQMFVVGLVAGEQRHTKHRTHCYNDTSTILTNIFDAIGEILLLEGSF